MEAIIKEKKETPVKAKAAKKLKTKKLPTLTCKNCGESFTTTSPHRSKSKMCSRSCATIFSNKNRVWSAESRRRVSIARKLSESRITMPGCNNINWKGGGVKFSCHCCLKTFEIPHNELSAGKKKGYYCSTKCYKISRAAKSKTTEMLVRCSPMYASTMIEVKRLQGIIKQVHEVSKIIISNLNERIDVPEPIGQIFSLTDMNEPS
jgi:hypothetical protein